MRSSLLSFTSAALALALAGGIAAQTYRVPANAPADIERTGEAARAFDGAHANATYAQAHYNEMQLPQNVDSVLMAQFYHDRKLGIRDASIRGHTDQAVLVFPKPR